MPKIDSVLILSIILVSLIVGIAFDYNSSRIESNYIPESSAYTKAVDVGSCEMQDMIFIFENGTLIDQIPIGEKFPQTEKFKNRHRLNSSC